MNLEPEVCGERELRSAPDGAPTHQADGDEGQVGQPSYSVVHQGRQFESSFGTIWAKIFTLK